MDAAHAQRPGRDADRADHTHIDSPTAPARLPAATGQRIRQQALSLRLAQLALRAHQQSR